MSPPAAPPSQLSDSLLNVDDVIKDPKAGDSAHQPSSEAKQHDAPVNLFARSPDMFRIAKKAIGGPKKGKKEGKEGKEGKEKH